MQVANDTSTFLMRRSSYVSINLLGWLWCLGYMGVASASLVLSSWLWSSCTHTLTIFLQWQDLLCALLWFAAVFSLAGAVFVMRFLSSTRMGYKRRMLAIDDDTTLVACDLSSENFLGIFYALGSGFWCFFLLLVGLLPEVLAGWLLRLLPTGLLLPGAFLFTLLGVAGLVLSVVSGCILAVGCVGTISTCEKMGEEQRYLLNDRLNLRVDDQILTVSYPGKAETMVDLQLLNGEDQKHLFLVLQKYGEVVQHRQENFEAEATDLTRSITGNLLLAG